MIQPSPDRRTALEVPEGEEFFVAGLDGDPALRERLAELGFAPGTSGRVVRRSPLGGALHVSVRGGAFAVRTDEAACVEVADTAAACPRCVSVDCSVPPMAEFQRTAVKPELVVLAGNPNVGKSSLFNALTGLRQRVGNYPGVTVERVTGTMTTPEGDARVVDLPGTYSLLASSPEERIARDVILGRIEGLASPDLVVVVLDAANLERSLFLATQILELGRPVVFALNQIDVAAAQGVQVDPDRLAAAFGVPVVPTCGRTGEGLDALRGEVARGGAVGRPLPIPFEPAVLAEADELVGDFTTALGGPAPARRALAGALCSHRGAQDLGTAAETVPVELHERVAAARQRLSGSGLDVTSGAAFARYAALKPLVAEARQETGPPSRAQAAADRVLTHGVIGTAVMVAVFAALFAVVFWAAAPAIDWVDGLMGDLAGWVGPLLGEGWLSSLVTDGVIGGVGGFLVFVPQIAMLFLCIHALEDSGYLARAAFLLDRVMGKVGLPGRAFVPMLSGFACAIPGIMAARAIENRRERLLTIAVLPWMSCSARMPVYAVIVGALFTPFGPWVPVAVIASMYLLGIVAAMVGAKVLRGRLLHGERTPLLLELPPYRRPSLRNVVVDTARRTWSFVAGAGPIIVALTIVMWVGTYFPRDAGADSPAAAQVAELEQRVEQAGDTVPESLAGELDDAHLRLASARTRDSYMGRAGQLIEPVIEPLGYDWKIGVGILASFAAREVFVPTLGVVYSVGDEAAEDDPGLLESIRNDRRPDGSAVFTPLVGISILVFYVLAMQCLSTLAVIHRETGGWPWTIGVLVGHTVVAYVAALLVFQVGTLLGF